MSDASTVLLDILSQLNTAELIGFYGILERENITPIDLIGYGIPLQILIYEQAAFIRNESMPDNHPPPNIETTFSGTDEEILEQYKRVIDELNIYAETLAIGSNPPRVISLVDTARIAVWSKDPISVNASIEYERNRLENVAKELRGIRSRKLEE